MEDHGNLPPQNPVESFNVVVVVIFPDLDIVVAMPLPGEVQWRNNVETD